MCLEESDAGDVEATDDTPKSRARTTEQPGGADGPRDVQGKALFDEP
jgi:hypothetical protein